jgi:regulator of sirC expression with transglutaminase-like and TPR domain
MDYKDWRIRFQRVAAQREEEIDIAEGALVIASDEYPRLDVDGYLTRLDVMAGHARPHLPADGNPRQVVDVLARYLFGELGFGGNRENYYDPRNSYLNEVLDRRLGIPISLSVLYWAVAEPLGLSIAGVNLPAHFMLRVDDGELPMFVDPFHAGAVMDRAACERRLSEILQQPVTLTDSTLAACSIEVIVTRMLRNLKAIYLGSQDVPSALPVQRRLVALNRQDAGELRDLAMLCIQADRPGEAIDPLQAYLDSAPPDTQDQQIRALFDVVRHRLAQWN